MFLHKLKNTSAFLDDDIELLTLVYQLFPLGKTSFHEFVESGNPIDMLSGVLASFYIS